MPHTLYQCGTIFGLEDDSRHAHGIAKEEALVQHLACAKRRQGRVPGETEQRNALGSRRTGRLVVVGDILRQWPVEVCRGGYGYETAGANLLDNFDEAVKLQKGFAEAWLYAAAAEKAMSNKAKADEKLEQYLEAKKPQAPVIQAPGNH